MTTLKLVLAFVRRKPLTWGFHALALALGVAVVTALLSLDTSLDNRFSRDLQGVDLVVGAKGSPLQLILSSVFELDTPTGNIPLSVANQLSQNLLVRRVVPVSLGDNVAGFRIVGTTRGYGELYGVRTVEGRWWTAPMQAVLGSRVAATLKLHPGDSFVGDHGLAPGGEAHKATPYTVVGVLAPTGAVVDGLALTDFASVWKVHERENQEHAEALAAGEGIDPHDVDTSPGGREVTALLVSYRSTMAALMLPRMLAAIPNLQTAIPAVEVARLTKLLGSAEILKAFGGGLLALSTLGFFVALFAAVSQRRGELALLRALGARPSRLFGLVAVEGLLLGVLSGAAGVAIGRLAAFVAAQTSLHSGGPTLSLPPPGLPELAIFLGAALLSLAASLAPAAIAYRLNPARALRS